MVLGTVHVHYNSSPARLVGYYCLAVVAKATQVPGTEQMMRHAMPHSYPIGHGQTARENTGEQPLFLLCHCTVTRYSIVDVLEKYVVFALATHVDSQPHVAHIDTGVQRRGLCHRRLTTYHDEIRLLLKQTLTDNHIMQCLCLHNPR